MAGRPTKLTPEVHRQVVAYFRAGSFEWVAAEAAGVSKSTFHRWLQRGATETRGAYHAFAEEVRQAKAQARVAAETEVRRTNPVAWLRYGPGRERPDEPGWTERQQHEVTHGRAPPGPRRGGGDDRGAAAAPRRWRSVRRVAGGVTKLGLRGTARPIKGSASTTGWWGHRRVSAYGSGPQAWTLGGRP